MAVLTGSESMSIWHWPSARKLAEFGDLRQSSLSWVRCSVRSEKPGRCLIARRWGEKEKLRVPLASLRKQAGQTHQVDYGIQCHYDGPTDRLLLAAGDFGGRVTIAEVQPTGIKSVMQVNGLGGPL